MKKNLLTRFLGLKGDILLLSLLLLSCLSCQKEEPQAKLPPVENEGITFRDGRLIFKDMTSFKDHQKWLFENQGNRQLIVAKNKSLGLKSMAETYFEGMELEETDPLFLAYVDKYPNIFNKEIYDNSTLYILPNSTLVCYVANKDGFFQVGDRINRIVWKYVYEITDGDESKIEMLLLPKEKISDKDIKITPSVSETKGDYAQRTKYFSNDRYRIVSSLREWVTLSIWYDELQTNPQKRTLGVWGRAQLNTKTANDFGYMTALYCPSCPWHYPIVPFEQELTGLTHDNYYWGDYQLDFSESYLPAYSRGRLESEYIYVYWPDALEVNPPVQEPSWTPDTEPF